MFNTDENPTEAGIYLVDRGDKFKGHWYRYYDGKGNWGCLENTEKNRKLFRGTDVILTNEF